MGAPVMIAERMEAGGGGRRPAFRVIEPAPPRAHAHDEDIPRDAAHPGGVNGAAAASLAYLAAAPLLGAAIWLVAGAGGRDATILHAMGTYGAALILFFAGVRWGVAVMKPGGPTVRALGGAALPFALALPLLYPFDPDLRLPALMLTILALLLDDLRATNRGDGAPTWYLAVRLPLTALVMVAFAVALAATAP
ncbi:MAG: DUF3429 family protein [Alphaproteobacteria bacterium]|nr:DUF3429 family protein [Alphaproteobacteria bacterium]